MQLGSEDIRVVGGEGLGTSILSPICSPYPPREGQQVYVNLQSRKGPLQRLLSYHKDSRIQDRWDLEQKLYIETPGSMEIKMKDCFMASKGGS